MENLNKHNFWDDIFKKYPDACKLFCDWIDKYKKEIGWDELFANIVQRDSAYRTPKFHEVPFEFQNGIIARFDIECFNGLLTGKGKFVYEKNRDDYVKGFTDLFADLQNQLNKQKQ